MTLPDLDKYRKMAEGFDLSDEQKDELIMTVWNIMGQFVDQAFGVHPVQLCQKNRESKHLTQ
ncbi:MAG: hypothetical protein PHD48_00205 [Alphaproteobacteria bacterium]|nr:hypothetical protein [Alphaproteobacteria bacterium]